MQAVIRGTRITVELILNKLAEGAAENELLEDYPNLQREDIRAAIAHSPQPSNRDEVPHLLLAPGAGVTLPEEARNPRWVSLQSSSLLPPAPLRGS